MHRRLYALDSQHQWNIDIGSLVEVLNTVLDLVNMLETFQLNGWTNYNVWSMLSAMLFQASFHKSWFLCSIMVSESARVVSVCEVLTHICCRRIQYWAKCGLSFVVAVTPHRVPWKDMLTKWSMQQCSLFSIYLEQFTWSQPCEIYCGQGLSRHIKHPKLGILEKREKCSTVQVIIKEQEACFLLVVSCVDFLLDLF